MEEIVVYVHGKGGSAQEAEHYKALFPGCEVIGFDYHARSPWEATEEFSGFFTAVRKRCGKLTLVANSISAFLSLSSLNEKLVDTAYFISPVVDMEQLICNMMQWADVSEAELAEKAIAEMEKTVMDAGWDGEWYLRAYDHYKNKIGSKECEDGKIFIEPQGFCVIAEIGKDEGLCLKAMQSVEKYLDTKYGIVLLQPPYHRYHVELGEISSYPPGYKENAGIFCHNNPWISIAETVIGRGNRAWQVYTRTCPAYIEDISEIHRTEPYVYSQMIAGKDAPNFGEAKNSWLTGTAAWTFLDVSQYILGIRPDYDGLIIDPCIPDTMDGFTAKRKFRGNTYHITVRNPAHVQKGVTKLIVDGATIDGNMIPAINGTGHDVTVEVTMG